jgi:uncharacterized membrane protein
MVHWFGLLSGLGFLISLYALFVRLKVLTSDSYSPWCDLRPGISCSKALGSSFSKTLGIPNPVGGLLFYGVLLLFCFFWDSYLYLTVFPAGAAFLFSLYLAFVSYFRQKNVCLVCSAIYLLNTALFVMSILLFLGH